jgi:hypothetical protein
MMDTVSAAMRRHKAKVATKPRKHVVREVSHHPRAEVRHEARFDSKFEKHAMKTSSMVPSMSKEEHRGGKMR